jgi:hypothetical protein
MKTHFLFRRFILLVLAGSSAAAALGQGASQNRILQGGAAVSATYVPVIASTAGLAGSRFVSSLALVNPHPFAMTVKLYLLPAGEDNGNFRASLRTVQLPPNGGTRIADPALTLWGRTELLAAVYAESDVAPGNDGTFMVDSPVLNVANPGATYGLSVPATLSGIGPQDLGYVPGVQSDSQYRTNVGLLNDSNSSSTVRVEVLNDAGVVLGSKDYVLLPYSLIQDPVLSITATPFSNGSIRIRPLAIGIGGQVIGYAIRADNTTSDPVAGPLAQPYRPLTQGPLVVELSRYRFSPGGPIDPPITLEAGRTYQIIFRSVDTTHGISPIPQLGIAGSGVIQPGSDYTVIVTPTQDQRGATYNFACTNFCGAGHGGMYGSIAIV